MSEQLQLRRGTSTQVAAFTGAAGECVVDTTNNRLVVGDGTTAGGWAAGLERRTAVADAAYSVLVTDRIVGYTSITAARAVALPAASAYPTGARLIVVDESGSCSATNTITLNRAGSDTIDGQTSSVINSSYGFVELESNGSNAWTFIGSMSTVARAPNGASMQFFIIEFLSPALSGASYTFTNAVPSLAIVFSVGAYVQTTITGATSYSVGDVAGGGDGSASASKFGSSLGISAGSSNYGLISPQAFNNTSNPTSIILTAAGSNFTAGKVRISIHYALCTPSSS